MSIRTPITAQQYQKMRQGAAAKERDLAVRNGILNVGLDETALNHASRVAGRHVFSLELPTGKITAQEKSGRCWLFAGLNTLRFKISQKRNLENFELSQSYLMFFDKLEKANYFLENILETRDEESDSRLLMWLLNAPLQDGGQWDMFTALVEKYGIVPKEAMPETFSSRDSSRMNSVLTHILRGNAAGLRGAYRKGAAIAELKIRKAEMLQEFYRLLTLFLGLPPVNFTWEYNDKDKRFVREEPCTPLSFYHREFPEGLRDYVSLINAPTPNKPFMQTFTVRYLGNVEGASPVKYLNVEMPLLKAALIRQLQDGDPVWFGSDVGKMMKREDGILDASVYEYEGVLDTQFTLDKGGRLEYGESLMTHAMVISGVNLQGSRPERWKVENSWGDKYGNQGYFVMSDSWFDAYVYQVVVHKKHMTSEMRKVWETEPRALNPWDPMGSLA
ncbi:MAG: C1 family peptidase [Candidatus Neomarinimicrobiota bacterium]|jgi:bleomycin hydrolase